jgi:gluconokinase
MTQIAWVVMGVSGSGKSEVGMRLAKALEACFIEGDSFHPSGNLAKMTAGIALGDDDRLGWLGILRTEIERIWGEGKSAVLACSALKRRYRDILRAGGGEVRFVHLHGERALITRRMDARTGHFMPAALLDSQLRDLEPLQPDEAGVTLDVRDPPDKLVEQALLSLPEPGID